MFMKFSWFGLLGQNDINFQCHVIYTVLAYCSHYNTVLCHNLVCICISLQTAPSTWVLYMHTDNGTCLQLEWHGASVSSSSSSSSGRGTVICVHIHVMWPLHAPQQVPWCNLTFYELAGNTIINKFAYHLPLILTFSLHKHLVHENREEIISTDVTAVKHVHCNLSNT